MISREVYDSVSLLPGKLHIQRRRAWVFTVFLLLCYYMLLPTRNASLTTIRTSYYVCVVPVLVAAVLYFRRLRDGTESRLLLALWIWFWFSRALNGSPFFEHDFQHFYEVSLIIPVFTLGLALMKTERTRFLDWLSVVLGGFYFVIGLIALIAFLHRTMYEFPILGGKIGIAREAGYARIYFFDNHPNVTAYWYLISLFLMIYQFFHCGRTLWRVPIIFSAAVDLVVIAITYSRSVRVCMSMTFALLAAMLLFRLLQSKSRLLRMAIVIPISVLVMAAAYEGSALCADVMATLSYRITDIQAPSEAIWQSAAPEETVQEGNDHSFRPVMLSSGKKGASAVTNLRNGLVQSDPREKTGDLNTLSSNRIDIWLGAFQTIKTMPSILWRGHLSYNIMSVAHQFMTPDGEGRMPVNFHNTFIEILMLTGLPGLILTLCFLVLVLYRGLRLFFCTGPMDVRTLVFPVFATVPYFMLETCPPRDIRLLFYLLTCGFVVAYAKEHSGK